jgi:hypothetical protein
MLICVNKDESKSWQVEIKFLTGIADYTQMDYKI